MIKELLLIAGAATISSLYSISPVSAATFDWQFTNENGNFGSSTDTIEGEVEFDDADIFPGATGVSATNFTLTNITGLDETSAPFFGNGGIELNSDLTSSSNANVFSFSSSQTISDWYFQAILNPDNREELAFRGNGGDTFIQNYTQPYVQGQEDIMRDFNSSTLEFTPQSAVSVPEFSPTLGLLVFGVGFAGSCYIKYRQTAIK